MPETNNGLTLLVGAGAECGAPYGLPVGDAFTWDTCFTKNEPLYSALGEYYAPCLNKLGKGYPHKYQGAFLYNPTSLDFKRLLSEMVPEARGEKPSEEELKSLRAVFGEEAKLNSEFIEKLRICDLSTDFYECAFEKIVGEATLSSEFVRDRDISLKEAYFGTIETHFSSLLNPARRNVSFWKLVNYYWSAFFSISRNLVVKAFPGLEELEPSEYYSYVLHNLEDVVHAISQDNLYSDAECAGTYYYELQGLFDYAITTNYTSLSNLLHVKGGPIHISGALWQFESLRSLSVQDISQGIDDKDELIFPYLLTQVPIKPVICWQQASEISRMMNALKETGDLCVLGYSFCKNDAHVSSIVASWLKQLGRRELHYYDHDGKCTNSHLSELLRIGSGESSKLHVYPCKNLRQTIEDMRGGLGLPCVQGRARVASSEV